MGKIRSEELIDRLSNTTGTILAQYEKEFAPLDESTIRTRPSSGGWSAAECLDHLNRINDHYLPGIEMAIAKCHKNGKKASATFRPGWLGGYFANAMKPREGKIRHKTKTFRDKNPQKVELDPNYREKFVGQQKHLLDLLEESRKVDLSGVRVKSLLGSIFKLKLGDALTLVVNHDERHMLQAKRALESVRTD